jgi:hypothetical protein
MIPDKLTHPCLPAKLSDPIPQGSGNTCFEVAPIPGASPPPPQLDLWWGPCQDESYFYTAMACFCGLVALLLW